MNKMTNKAALLAIAFIVSIPLGLPAQDEGFYPYSFARLTYVNGAVYVQRSSDLGYEQGEVNLALVRGDKIGTEKGQAEIHFGRRNYLRLDDNTKAEFVLLPTEGEERIKIHLTEGRAYFRVSHLALDKGFEVHTPDASFYVLETGLYRFDVRLGRETQAVVREGSLEAAAEDGSVLVGHQETVTASEGRLLGDPYYAYARDDAFDAWNGGRDAQLSARSERRYLPSEMEEYEEELDQNGHWVYEQPYGNVWVPNVSRYDDWRPYFYGRWLWYPVIGWTWVSSESWGWPVYHYGRWNWRFGLGWYWIPRHHWGPAWVHWWSDHSHIGWCPLTWHNRPAYLWNNRFYDRHDDRWFSARNRAMTVVRRDHLQSPEVGRRHLGAADLDRIGRVELKAQQPSIRPSVDNARPQAIAARRALADRGGSRSEVRTLAPSRSLASPRTGAVGRSPVIRGNERSASPAPSDRQPVSRTSIRSYPSRATSRSATVREPQGARSAGSGAGSAVTRPPSDPTGRSQSRTYAPRSQVSSPSSQPRVSAPSRARPSSPSYASPGASGTSSSRPRSLSSAPPRSSDSSGRSINAPRSSASSGRSYAAPRSSSSSPGRSLSAPRSSGASGRSISAPRSSGSSTARSSGSMRSGGSSSGRAGSSGRSSSSSSKSSGSASRSSGAAKRKG